MDRNQLTEEIIKNLITIQNKLKNSIIKKEMFLNISFFAFKIYHLHQNQLSQNLLLKGFLLIYN